MNIRILYPAIFFACFITCSMAADVKKSKAKSPEKQKQRELLRSSGIFKTAKKIWKQLKHVNLTRREPIEIGHETAIEVSPGHKILLKTVSIQPPIFEIDDFLDTKECDHILTIAKAQELEISLTYADNNDKEFHSLAFPCDPFSSNFSRWDTNKDGFLDGKEGAIAISGSLDLFISAPVFEYIIRDSWWDFNRDGLLSQYEFYRVNSSRLNETVEFLKEFAPQYRSRHSTQTWIELDRDGIIEDITSRVISVTGLPGDIIKSSEALQVVHYGNQGHYNCHMDTEDTTTTYGRPCCHNKMMSNESMESSCIPCRYATLLYFLNDVEQGGETAFPMADDLNLSEDNPDLSHDQRCNLELSCHKANVLVKPKKGKAIMWYNNFVNSTSQWVGKSDLRSHHGGCHVLRGEKWIANNWINVGPVKMKDAVSIAKYQSNRTELEFIMKHNKQQKLDAVTTTLPTDL